MGAVARKKQKKKKGYCTIQQLKQAFYILKGMADNLNTPQGVFKAGATGISSPNCYMP